MKKAVRILLAMGLTTIMSTTALAAAKLPAPSWAKWGTRPGEATWEVVLAAEGEYRIEYFMDGELVKESSWKRNTSGSANFYYDIFEEGDYTFHVKSKGDGIQSVDSEFSTMSAVYTYEKPDISFPEAKNPRWSSDNPNMAVWDAPEGIDGYESYLRYRLVLYADGTEVFSTWAFTDNYQELTEEMTEEADYTFSVEACSNNIEKIAHSGKVYSDGSIDVPDNNNRLNDHLDQLLEATPSNALKELEADWEIEDIAVGMQSNRDILNKISSLEDAYLDEKNGTVEKHVAEDVEMNPDDITLVGAGLNLATPSNAVKFHVKKPDKEANVDKTLYKNTFQVDLSLSGTVDRLRIPVTITMPVPQGINPDRLFILHYKKDGSYTLIKPLLEQDGMATFTVTEFSVFVFAEKAEQNNNNNNSSGGGGGGRIGVRTDANVPGTWMMGEQGWQFKKQNGELVKNSWLQTNNQWYFMNHDGFMTTKWIYWQDNWYYLNPEKGALEGVMKSGWLYDPDYQKWYYLEADGRMQYGWKLINEKWYYLNPQPDGTKGAMAVDTMIDGYQIGSDGAMKD